MNTFLQAVGITALVVIGLVVLLILAAVAFYFWLVKVKLPQMAGRLGDELGGFMAGAAALEARPTMTLTPVPDPADRPDGPGLASRDDGLDAAYLSDAARDFAAAGLAFGGRYAVDELPGSTVLTFADPARCVVATASVVPGAGEGGAAVRMADAITVYDDGRSATHTDCPPQGVDRPPFKTIVRVPPGTPAAELVARHLAERPAGAMRPIGPGDVAAVAVERHDLEMDWRDSRGGMTEAELRAAAAKTGQTLSDAEVASALEAVRSTSVIRFELRSKERFAAATTMSVADWERVDDRLLVVHDGADAEVLAEEVVRSRRPGEAVDARAFEAEQSRVTAALRAGPLREAFAAANAASAESARCERVGSLPGPMAVDFYAGPPIEESDDDD